MMFVYIILVAFTVFIGILFSVKGMGCYDASIFIFGLLLIVVPLTLFFIEFSDSGESIRECYSYCNENDLKFDFYFEENNTCYCKPKYSMSVIINE